MFVRGPEKVLVPPKEFGTISRIYISDRRSFVLALCLHGVPLMLCYVFFCNSFLFLFQEYNRHSELLKPESNAIDHGPSNYKSGKTPKTFMLITGNNVISKSTMARLPDHLRRRMIPRSARRMQQIIMQRTNRQSLAIALAVMGR